MQTKDLSQEKIRLIRELFPDCVTESRERERTVLSVDFDALRQELSGSIVEGQQERYQFTWPDKSKAKRLANTPTTMTLRPCREESVDFDNTKNLYIEGDNLEVLKILRETYLGKVKMIYIDPPYNTGNDFVYNDDFSMSAEDYSEIDGESDDSGNRLFRNTSNNGRFHTDWLNMIYPRLLLAKDLLSKSGAVFISIDDNEIENLRKICDEIYGESNFVSQLSVIVKTEGRQYGFFAKTHEYILIYAKSICELSLNKIKSLDAEFKYFDDVGGFNTIGLRNRAVRIFNSTNRPNLRYPFFVDVNNPDQYGFFKVSVKPLKGWVEVWPDVVDGLESVWRWGKETADLKKNELVAMKGKDGEVRIFKKDRELTTLPKTVWFDKDFNSIVGTREVSTILGKGMFDFPKPLSLIKQLVKIGSDEDSVIVDFFSGSATTAHAVMELNLEDGGNRRFITIQIPEKTEVESPANANGYKNICEIGKERIRRAGSEIKRKDPSSSIDIGFRVFKCDSSNMRDVFYHPDVNLRDTLEDYNDLIKNDRRPEDLLIQVMLECGVELSSKIERKELNGHIVFSVDDGYLVACFDDLIDDSTVTEMSREMSGCMYAVFRSGSSMSDAMLANIEQIFKTYSPQTKIRIL